MAELRQRSPRQQDAKHLAYVRAQPCCVCGSTRNVEAAHLRMACAAIGKLPTGMQEKPDDKWSTPLCAYHHRTGILAQHKIGEEEFWILAGINPFELAARLFMESGGTERALQPAKPQRVKRTAPRKPRDQRKKIQNRGFDDRLKRTFRGEVVVRVS